ncbi:hypothetical protein ABBQ32_000358 [Trebouxia sp. C0010 RCD-2024]
MTADKRRCAVNLEHGTHAACKAIKKGAVRLARVYRQAPRNDMQSPVAKYSMLVRPNYQTNLTWDQNCWSIRTQYQSGTKVHMLVHKRHVEYLCRSMNVSHMSFSTRKCFMSKL